MLFSLAGTVLVQPRAAAVSAPPPGCRRCAFCCDTYNPMTHEHCVVTHVTSWKSFDILATSTGGATVFAAPPSALVTAIADRETARLACEAPPADPLFDHLMALKCDLIDVEAAIPWEVRAWSLAFDVYLASPCAWRPVGCTCDTPAHRAVCCPTVLRCHVW